MDATRRIVYGLLIILAVPVAVLLTAAAAVLVALLLHLRVLWHLGAALGRGLAALPGWLVTARRPLPEELALRVQPLTASRRAR